MILHQQSWFASRNHLPSCSLVLQRSKCDGLSRTSLLLRNHVNQVRVLDTSFLYETKPIYVEDQPSFINGACIVTQKQSTPERQAITHAERPGGLFAFWGMPHSAVPELRPACDQGAVPGGRYKPWAVSEHRAVSGASKRAQLLVLKPVHNHLHTFNVDADSEAANSMRVSLRSCSLALREQPSSASMASRDTCLAPSRSSVRSVAGSTTTGHYEHRDQLLLAFLRRWQRVFRKDDKTRSSRAFK
jgi:hypothetical protein